MSYDRQLMSDFLVDMSNAHFHKLASLSAKAEGAAQLGKVAAHAPALEDPFLQKMAAKLDPVEVDVSFVKSAAALEADAAWELLGDDHMEKVARAIIDEEVTWEELSELEKVAIFKQLAQGARAVFGAGRKVSLPKPGGGPGIGQRLRSGFNRVTGRGWKNMDNSSRRGSNAVADARRQADTLRSQDPSGGARKLQRAPAGQPASGQAPHGQGPHRQPARQAPAPTPPARPASRAPGNRSGASTPSSAEWNAAAAARGKPSANDAAAQMRSRWKNRGRSTATPQQRNAAHWAQQKQQSNVGRMASGERLPTSGTPSGDAVQSLSEGTTKGARKPLMNWRTKAMIGTGAVGAGGLYLGGKGLDTANTFLHQQPGGSYQQGMGSPSHFMNSQQM